MNKSVNQLGVDLSPDYEIFKILQEQNYEIEIALAEFIDNSIQSFIECGDRLKVESKIIDIYFNNDGKDIVIQDNAGGISRDRFKEAMRPGRGQASVHPNDSLSKYGIGLKTAAMWLTNTWNLETKHFQETGRVFLNVALDKMLDPNNDLGLISRHSPDEDDTPTNYTIITIENCIKTTHLKIKDCEEIILPYILETFQRFIAKGITISLYFNGDPVKSSQKKLFLGEAKLPPPLVEYKFGKDGTPADKKLGKITWEEEVSFEDGKKKAKGKIRIMKKGSYYQPGIRLFRNDRVIQGTSAHRNIAEDIFKTKNKYASQRIYGELDLEGFTVNYQKNGFSDNLKPMYKKIKEQLKDLLEQADNYRIKNKGNKSNTDPDPNPTSRPSKTKHPPNDTIEEDTEITEKLKQMDLKKMEDLYRSLCGLSLKKHPILMNIAAWTFLEVLVKIYQDLKNFNKDKLPDIIETMIKDAVSNKVFKQQEGNTISRKINGIREEANIDKHDKEYAPENASNLKPIFKHKAIKKFIIWCLDEIIESQEKEKKK